jgi:hypothetical protein
MTQSGKSESADAMSPEKLWRTPVEIRDRLKSMGSLLKTTRLILSMLKRMVPGEMEVKTLKGGQKVYRLKSAGDWAQAFAEARDWMKGSVASKMYGATAMVIKRPMAQQEAQERKEQDSSEGAKHGSSGRT